ncbi:MAG TPA: cytidine deaminase [Candidatus Limnocylindria bacterium]|nr:cytidine deaminase [Candidatus Limnocylindria bacterium]
MIQTRAARAPMPFPADSGFAGRVAGLSERVGPAVEADVAALVEGRPAEPLGGSTVPAAVAAELIARHELASVVELALLALPVAGAMARPSISGYRVAAVGIEAPSGDLVLGANLEFPGAELTSTIHAEGFVALRARRRSRALATLVVREARPCAFCRQTLAESAAADGLAIVDALGHALALDNLYPAPFQPRALGVTGDTPGRVAWPELAFVATVPRAAIATTLVEAGSRAHAPYSGTPSAVVLRTADGRIAAAGCVESVAFNPSITALQAALVELAAARIEPSDIEEAWLGCVNGGVVDPEPGFRALLHAVAPVAGVHVARWAIAR